MTAIYHSPARPWAFGPFSGHDVVTQQAEALVQRYDLLEALAADGPVRRDLDPAMAIDRKLQEVIVRQLVPWVDYEPLGDVHDDGWPIPKGVRVEALCYSAWLDRLRGTDGSIDSKRMFAPPDSATEFARQFHVRAGIRTGANRTVDPAGLDAQFRHGFKLTPLIVGEVAMSLRAAGLLAERAFRLLMSREYGAACAADGRLLDPHPLLQACGFNDGAVVAFERLDEIARIGMIVRDVERLARAGAKLRVLLEAANEPAFVAANSILPGVAYAPALAAALASDPAMRDLCDYLAVGTDVLASWRNAVVADRGTFHPGFRPAAFLAGGSIESDIGAALSQSVDVRTAFLSAFDPPRIGRGKQSALQNDGVAKFYGLTNFSANLAAALMADFTATRRVGAPRGRRPQGITAKTTPHDVRESIPDIVAHLGRDGDPVYAGVQTVRSGAPLSKIMLPERGTAGSAPRADDAVWHERYRDQPFWARFQDPDATWFAQLSMRPRDRDTLHSAVVDLRKLAIARLDWAPSSLTARVVADLATGVSAISINPAFARSMRDLVRFNGEIARAEKRWARLSEKRQRALSLLARLGVFSHGRRWIEGIKAIADPARHRKNAGGNKRI